MTVAASGAAAYRPDIRAAFPLQIWRRTHNRNRSSGRCPAPRSIRCTRRCPSRPAGQKQPSDNGSTTPRRRSSSHRRASRIPAPCWTASSWPATPVDTAPRIGRVAYMCAPTAVSSGTRFCIRRNRDRKRTCSEIRQKKKMLLFRLLLNYCRDKLYQTMDLGYRIMGEYYNFCLIYFNKYLYSGPVGGNADRQLAINSQHLSLFASTSLRHVWFTSWHRISSLSRSLAKP